MYNLRCFRAALANGAAQRENMFARPFRQTICAMMPATAVGIDETFVRIKLNSDPLVPTIVCDPALSAV